MIWVTTTEQNKITEKDLARFWRRVTVDSSGCLLWEGSCTPAGYGKIKVRGRVLVPHRVAWVLAGYELIPGMELDHTCEVRRCVSVQHLEQVTHGENLRRRYNRKRGTDDYEV